MYMNQIEDVEAEVARFDAAIEKAIKQQGILYEKAKKDAGEESAGIFEAHQLMLEDEDLQDAAKEIITGQKRSAEYATKTAFDEYAQMFAEMDDPYMKARSARTRQLLLVPGSEQGCHDHILALSVGSELCESGRFQRHDG